MGQAPAPATLPHSRLIRWLLKGQYPQQQGPYKQERQQPEHPWWQVMCLTGVDYFSTLGYQPGDRCLSGGHALPSGHPRSCRRHPLRGAAHLPVCRG